MLETDGGNCVCVKASWSGRVVPIVYGVLIFISTQNFNGRNSEQQAEAEVVLSSSLVLDRQRLSLAQNLNKEIQSLSEADLRN